MSNYLYFSTALDTKTSMFEVLDVEGEEQLSGLFRYQLTLASKNSKIDASELLGKNANLIIEDKSAQKHYRNGLISQFSLTDKKLNYTHCQITVSPWLWLLTQGVHCRIFQNKTLIEIIAAVFSGYSQVSYKDQTTASYAQQDYCVQYRESDFNFVSRLMEEAGIGYFFQHEEGKHSLILTDSNDRFPKCLGLGETKIHHKNWQTDQSILDCSLQHQITSNGYSTSDYNFETPDVDLGSNAQNKPQGQNILGLDRYDYPGGYQQTKQGESLSKVRLQAQQHRAQILSGNSVCRAFVPGHTFILSEPERKEINGTYILSHLCIQADQDKYRNQFKAFAKNRPFRPPQTSRKPCISGTQTALVVGKRGEEICTDKYGRIKLQFFWDRQGKKDENSSCWVRVAQMWAGKGWGSQFIPRVGTEVIVTFLEGDPNRPIVTGSVYNANQTLPYSLPDQQNISTLLSRTSKQGSAGNELRFNDTKDAEELYLRSQKDMNLSVENSRSETLNKGDDNLLIKKGHRNQTLKEGNDQLIVEKGTRSITVKGDETHSSQAIFSHSVSKDYRLSVNGNLDINVRGNITINGKDIQLNANQNLVAKAKKAINTEAGTDLKNKAGDKLTNTAGDSMINDGGKLLENKAAIIKLN